MLKVAFLFTVVFLGFVACKGSKTASTTNNLTSSNLDKFLGTWMRSQEEDNGGEVLFYRSTADFQFPAARGRTGFMFEKDGVFTEIGIAPADGAELKKGKYTFSKDAKSIAIKLDSGEAYTLEIVSFENKLLKIKRK